MKGGRATINQSPLRIPLRLYYEAKNEDLYSFFTGPTHTTISAIGDVKIGCNVAILRFGPLRLYADAL